MLDLKKNYHLSTQATTGNKMSLEAATHRQLMQLGIADAGGAEEMAGRARRMCDFGVETWAAACRSKM